MSYPARSAVKVSASIGKMFILKLSGEAECLWFHVLVILRVVAKGDEA